MSVRRQASAAQSSPSDYPADRLPHRLRSGCRYRAAFTKFNDSGFYGPGVWDLFVADDEKCRASFDRWLSERGISQSLMDDTYKSALKDAVARFRAVYGINWAKAYGEKLIKESARGK